MDPLTKGKGQIKNAHTYTHTCLSMPVSNLDSLGGFRHFF